MMGRDATPLATDSLTYMAGVVNMKAGTPFWVGVEAGGIAT